MTVRKVHKRGRDVDLSTCQGLGDQSHMLMLAYPDAKPCITVGQAMQGEDRHLIKDISQQRCSPREMITALCNL
jgi:hypothetical protein